MENVFTENEIRLIARRKDNGRDYSDVLKGRTIHNAGITAEQTAKGIAWLMKWGLKDTKTADAKCKLGGFEKSVVMNFSHFCLYGFATIQTTPLFSKTLPVYQVFAKDGSSFKYYASPYYFGIYGKA